jgi:hypothetical protein
MVFFERNNPGHRSHRFYRSAILPGNVGLVVEVLMQLWQDGLPRDEHRQGEEEVAPVNGSVEPIEFTKYLDLMGSN